jgi:hypothetical protein
MASARRMSSLAVLLASRMPEISPSARWFLALSLSLFRLSWVRMFDTLAGCRRPGDPGRVSPVSTDDAGLEKQLLSVCGSDEETGGAILASVHPGSVCEGRADA